MKKYFSNSNVKKTLSVLSVCVNLLLSILSFAQDDNSNSANFVQGQPKPIVITDKDLKDVQATSENIPAINDNQKSIDVNDPIQILTKTDKQTITIGDAILFSISIEWEKGINILKVDPSPALGVFEIQDIHQSKETKLSKTRLKREYSYTLSTFDTGDYEIPPFKITYTTKDKQEKTAYSLPIKIHVKSVAGTADSKTEIKDIKAPAKLPSPPTWKIMGAIAIFILLIGLPLAYYIRKRILIAKGLIKEEVISRPPEEIAKEGLEKLAAEADEILSKGLFKEFYTRVSEILRVFIGRKFNINAIDMTSYELMLSIPEFIEKEDVISDLRDFLDEADFVKFAKYLPSIDMAKQMLVKVQMLIDRISPFPLEREELKGEKASPPLPQEAAPSSVSSDGQSSSPSLNDTPQQESEERK